MSEIRLTVVVPVYGVEEFIADCLWSILQDPMADMEVLVINDCTLDSSALIARQFAEVDTRVRVIDHEQNMGLGAARNTGLREARGQYVTFPDSDDRVVPGAYSRIIRGLDRSGSSFATAPAQEFGARRRRYWTTDSSVFDEDRVAVELASFPELIEDHTAWNKVFRRSFLTENGIEWPVGVKCEDVVPSVKAYLSATSVDVFCEVSYLYRRRRDSITTALGSSTAFADWVGQSYEALSSIANAPAQVGAVLAKKILVREYLAQVRLDAVSNAEGDIQRLLSRLIDLGCGYLTSDSLGDVSSADRLRIGLTAGGSYGELERWANRSSQSRRDDLDSATEHVPVRLRRLLGFGDVDYLRDESARFSSTHGMRRGPRVGPQLSVVIPVHNVAEYIDETLRSILDSRGVDLEVIVVDDWSTDNTRDVALRHASIDSRVRVLRSTGRGGGQARNVGVQASRGRYLAFADGDDLVPPGAYHQMLLVADAESAEMVTGKHLRTYTSSTWDPTDRLYPLVGVVANTSIKEYPSLIHPRTIWNRVFLREFWDRAVAPFCSVPRANDIVPFTNAVLRAERVTYVPVFTYIYRARPGQGSMTARLGESSSIVSYMSEELTCARMIMASQLPRLVDAYWKMVLVEDGWGNLARFLETDADGSFDNGTVSTSVRRLLASAPKDVLRGIGPDQQAVWALVSDGDLHSARSLFEAMRQPASVPIAETLGFIDAAVRTRALPSKTLDHILWKYLVRRLVDSAGSLTLAEARCAVATFLSSGRASEFVAAPETHEDRVVRAARANAPEAILDLGKRSIAPETKGVFEAEEFIHLDGSSIPGATAYRWLFLRGYGAQGHLRRVPIALMRLDSDSDRWNARIRKSSLPVGGSWEIWCAYEDDTGVRTGNTGLRQQDGRLYAGSELVFENTIGIAQRAARKGDWRAAVRVLEPKLEGGYASIAEARLAARSYRMLYLYDQALVALSAAAMADPHDASIRSQLRSARLRAMYHRSPFRRVPLPGVLRRSLK